MRAESRRVFPRLVVALAAAALLVAGVPGVAVGKSAKFDTGIADRLFRSSDAAERNLWQDRAAAASAGFLRIDVIWRDVVGSEPANPRSPSDPAYEFADLDAAVRAASARGLQTLLTVRTAPDWAEGPGRQEGAGPGTWKPDAGAFGDFGRALAARYSGTFRPLGAASPLPRVQHYEAWNEPNLGDPVGGPRSPGGSYLNPQWRGKTSVAPTLYTRMLNAFYDAVHSVNDSNKVLAPALSPYGSNAGGHRTRPVQFLREMFCLKGRKRLKPMKGCSLRPKFDILSHHPINTSGGPHRRAIHPDDASSADLGRVKRVVKKAERVGHARGARKHPLWVTEFSWPTNPPAPWGVKPQKQAKWIEQAMYIFWRKGARVAINFLIRDPRYLDGNYFQSGLYYLDGSAKPSAKAFRFPFVTRRLSGGRLEAWGKAPVAGKVKIQKRQGGRWRTLKRVRAQDGKVFTTRVRSRGRSKLRAQASGETSLVWKQR